MAKSFMNKVKDVATFKTLKDNFFKNDGSISQWFAHGATEAANMVIHGHAAPMYAGNVSPPDGMSSSIQEGAPEQGQELSFLSQKIQDLQQQPELEEPEIEISQ